MSGATSKNPKEKRRAYIVKFLDRHEACTARLTWLELCDRHSAASMCLAQSLCALFCLSVFFAVGDRLVFLMFSPCMFSCLPALSLFACAPIPVPHFLSAAAVPLQARCCCGCLRIHLSREALINTVCLQPAPQWGKR